LQLSYRFRHPGAIGRFGTGFGFPGYDFGRAGLTVAGATTEQLVAPATRFCEKNREEPCSPSRPGVSVRRWIGRAMTTQTDRLGPLHARHRPVLPRASDSTA
jgi:hypothetical protein